MPRLFAILIPIAIGVSVFCTGLNWGLPSAEVNRFLFANHPVWSGKQILQLLPAQPNLNRGADVAGGPILNRNVPVNLNNTNAKRAEIVRRYRLFSHQPDEMITFMSLSRMNPSKGDFDPRLYQYGSLWIYPVGALLKICSLLHLIQLRSDMAYYLDHPAQFGKFYIVARAYVAAWAILGILVVGCIATRFNHGRTEPRRPNYVPGESPQSKSLSLFFETSAAGSPSEPGKQVGLRASVPPWLNFFFNAQIIASLGFIFLPVVVYSAHEAKPHLPGAVLSLLAILAGMRFLETGRRRDGLAVIFCVGLSCSMVLSTLPMLAFVPCIFMLKSPRMAIRGLCGAVIAIAIYLLLDPYIWIDFFWHRQRLFSNISNSAAMYHFSALSAIGNAAALMIEGTSLVVFILGIAGVLFLFTHLLKNPGSTSSKFFLALIIPTVLMLIPFIVFASGKPAEYARFAILPDILLMLIAVFGCTKLPILIRPFVMALLLVCAAIPAFGYWRSYCMDHGSTDTRLLSAEALSNWPGPRKISVALTTEPAPYCCPPMNLFDWRLILLPRSQSPSTSSMSYNLALLSIDYPPAPSPNLQILPTSPVPRTPMSWANKYFAIYTHAPSPAQQK